MSSRGPVSAESLPDLDRGDGLPVYRQLVNILRAAILSGVIKVDEQLPSTGELQARYGLANATVQHAISVLREDGYVRPVHGRGVFVCLHLEQMTFRLIPEATKAREDAARLIGVSETDTVNRALIMYAKILAAVVELGGDLADGTVLAVRPFGTDGEAVFRWVFPPA